MLGVAAAAAAAALNSTSSSTGNGLLPGLLNAILAEHPGHLVLIKLKSNEAEGSAGTAVDQRKGSRTAAVQLSLTLPAAVRSPPYTHIRSNSCIIAPARKQVAHIKLYAIILYATTCENVEVG